MGGGKGKVSNKIKKTIPQKFSGKCIIGMAKYINKNVKKERSNLIPCS